MKFAFTTRYLTVILGLFFYLAGGYLVRVSQMHESFHNVGIFGISAIMLPSVILLIRYCYSNSIDLPTRITRMVPIGLLALFFVIIGYMIARV
jgi:hypothetical protein